MPKQHQAAGDNQDGKSVAERAKRGLAFAVARTEHDCQAEHRADHIGTGVAEHEAFAQVVGQQAERRAQHRRSGDADETVTVKEGERLADLSPGFGTLWTVEGGNHAFGASHPVTEPPPTLALVVRGTVGFFAENLASATV